MSSYGYQKRTAHDILVEAYQKCGIEAAQLSNNDILIALSSLNFILQGLTNRGVNLWKLKKGMMPLIKGQTSYALPEEILDFYDLSLRYGQGNLISNVTAYHSEQGPLSALYDGIGKTNVTFAPPSLSQTSLVLSMTLGASQTPPSQAPAVFGFDIQDGDPHTFYLANSNQEIIWHSDVDQVFDPGIYLFDVSCVSYAETFALEDLSDQTLILRQLYLFSNVTDTKLTRVGYDDYMNIANKTALGMPSTYFVDRQSDPVMYPWLIPGPQLTNYFAFQYMGYQAFQDITNLASVPDIVPRFYSALIYALAVDLALKKEKKDLLSSLMQLADAEFKVAQREDSEKASFSFDFDYTRNRR